MSFEMEERLNAAESLSSSGSAYLKPPTTIITPPSGESRKRTIREVAKGDDGANRKSSKRVKLSEEEDEVVLESPLLTPSRHDLDVPFPSSPAASAYNLSVLSQVASELLTTEVFV